MSFQGSVKKTWGKYAQFRGRSSRAEFWWWILFVAIVNILTGVILSLLQNLNSSLLTNIGWVVATIIWLALIIPTIAVAARRLHDRSLTAWLLLLFFVPFGNIVLIVLWLLPSKHK